MNQESFIKFIIYFVCLIHLLKKDNVNEFDIINKYVSPVVDSSTHVKTISFEILSRIYVLSLSLKALHCDRVVNFCRILAFN